MASVAPELPAGPPQPPNSSNSTPYSSVQLIQAMPYGSLEKKEPFEGVRALMDAYVHGGQLPGAFGAVIKKGQTNPVFIYNSGWGNAHDPKLHGAYGEKALYRFFSMTKPIVSTVAMMFIEDGKLSLEDPVSKYISAFKEMKVLNDDGTLREAKTPMLIKHILSHTSGLQYSFFGSATLNKYYEEQELSGITPLFAHTSEEMCARIAKVPLAFEPGTHFQYGVSTDVVGRVLEVIAKEPLSKILKTKILTPLGMEDTMFHVPKELVPRVRELWYFKPGFIGDTVPFPGEEKATERGLGAPTPLESGGGGLFSTGADYLKFMRFLLDGGEYLGKRLLSEKMFDIMTKTNALPKADLFSSTRPDGYPRVKGAAYNYMGSFTVDPTVVPGSKRSAKGEFGWGGYASTYFQVDRQKGLAYVFLTQLMPSSALPIRNQFKYMVHECFDSMEARSGEARSSSQPPSSGTTTIAE